jgi:hypothetical protein
MPKSKTAPIACAQHGRAPISIRTEEQISSALKARQAAKIREIRTALVDAGYLTVDKQAAALGLARSTAWTVLRANHKSSGLSASVLKRILRSPELPPKVRRIVEDYVELKCAGAYGHGRKRLQAFRAQLAGLGPTRGSD